MQTIGSTGGNAWIIDSLTSSSYMKYT